MTFYEPTRNPLIINRRRLMGFLAGAVAAGIVTKSEALAYLQDAKKSSVGEEEGDPNKTKAGGGTREGGTGSPAAPLQRGGRGGAGPERNANPNGGKPRTPKGRKRGFDGGAGGYPPNTPLEQGGHPNNDLLEKIRTAAAGGAAPDVAKMPILWGVEFAAKGHLREVTLEEFGWTTEQFWPGAIKSVTWDGKLYGVPTNNETMALIWNKPTLRRRRARSREAAGHLGRRRRLLQADQAGDSARTATAWSPRSTPATPRSASCR